MTDIELKKQALKDFGRLKRRFSKDKHLSLKELNDKYGGMNYYCYDDKLFDLNFGVICATFRKDEKGNVYLDDSIEIYDDDNNDFLGNFWVKLLRKEVKGI